MSAHTPAPWSVCGAEGCTCSAVLYRDGVICEVRDCNDDMADASGHAPSPEEAQANKRLIAAAPELLAALQSLQSFVAVMVGRGPDATIPDTITTPIGVPVKIGQIMRDAEAAISKAEGRT